MNDLGKQICRCIAGACDETCRHYDAEKSCCVGYEEVVQQAEKAFAEYENYKDLDEQGKLLKLPCAVGDKVFIIVGKDISKQTVKKIIIREDSVIIEANKRIFNKICFGKTVFLTREEAEDALKKNMNI